MFFLIQLIKNYIPMKERWPTPGELCNLWTSRESRETGWHASSAKFIGRKLAMFHWHRRMVFREVWTRRRSWSAGSHRVVGKWGARWRAVRLRVRTNRIGRNLTSVLRFVKATRGSLGISVWVVPMSTVWFWLCGRCTRVFDKIGCFRFGEGIVFKVSTVCWFGSKTC